MLRDAPQVPLKVLIVCEHASAKFGGEAVLPLHYFRFLRMRGTEVWMLTHERTRSELSELLPTDLERIHFLGDTRFNKLMWRLGLLLPAQVAYFTTGYLSRVSTQLGARRLARKLIAANRIDVVHQPIPVSPREPSLLFNLGAPLVVGPMNGNMSFPPAFRRSRARRMIETAVRLGRSLSGILHRVAPGKLKAAALLIANDRTLEALPKGSTGEVIQLVENGVDLGTWFPPDLPDKAAGGVIKFTFVGRLVDWKAVDIALEAFARFRPHGTATLEIIGDGPMRRDLEALCSTLGLGEEVKFLGWQSQQQCAHILRQSDALILPSLYECGGAVVLEAMATGVPVIATKWGGPEDYLDETCGVLVPPDSRESLIEGFSRAMRRLHDSADLRREMGRQGRKKVEAEYDWNAKIDRIIDIYASVSRSARATVAPLPPAAAR